MSPTAPQPERPRHDRSAARALANERLAAMRARTRRIRVRVAGGATALFVAAFAAIYAQMASGHDPALAKHASAGHVTASTASQGASGASTVGGSEASTVTTETAGSQTAGSERSSSETEASSVTTSQS